MASLELENIPVILDGTFFEIESVNGNKVVAKCIKCVPAKPISGCLTATSNFITHLTRVHPSLVSAFEEHKRTVEPSVRSKRKMSTDDQGSSSLETKKKQMKLSDCRTQSPSQGIVDELITNFVIGNMSSLRVVECPQFRTLIKGLAPHVSVMCRKTLSKRIVGRHENMIVEVTEKLAAAHYICTTADAWSVDGRGYIGVTAHWIDSITLDRKSAALACSRLTGSHTFDVIANAICQVFSTFSLEEQSGKLICCITDNGANFVKAFREFGLEYGYGNDGSDDCDDEDEVDSLEMSSVSDVLDGDSHDSSLIYLPPHHPCSAHTLSLIAVTDSQHALKDNASFKRIHNATLAKCSAVWNATSRSVKNAEAVYNIVNRRLVKPCATRWNSLFDALLVMQAIRPNIKNICQAIGIAVFKDQELDFIDEYIAVLRPIATALDRLQGDKSDSMSFMGALLPTVLTVQQKLTEISQSSSLVYCKPLANALLDGLQKRFGHLLSFDSAANEYVIAAVSHPFFKLRWIPEEYVEQCRLLFVRTRVAADVGGSTESAAASVSESQHQDDFFSFATRTAPQSNIQENSLQVT